MNVDGYECPIFVAVDSGSAPRLHDLAFLGWQVSHDLVVVDIADPSSVLHKAANGVLANAELSRNLSNCHPSTKRAKNVCTLGELKPIQLFLFRLASTAATA
jgi:hypothetical protein